ncbi:hypothetical protein [Herbaspirillum seropedicae]|uniref:hypothetical protein n=1 Tax=Herbaspirillum seropedicae TaxID=964 RepID=UPI00285A8E1A|nr:hypothetical protein [Herbaspirillum seropedicae]MDR6394650.1 hypothetical protein [Herbaspirillum seropedicae]
MSAFCVFGVSRSDCMRIAEKKIKRYDDEKKRNLTMEEWRAAVDALAQDLFATTTRHRQVSPAFDAPQFARDWVAVAVRSDQVKGADIRVRDVVLDGEGKPVKRNGKILMTWQHFKG